MRELPAWSKEVAGARGSPGARAPLPRTARLGGPECDVIARARACRPRPWPLRSARARPWSVNHSGIDGARSGVSDCIRCSWTRLRSGGPGSGRSRTAGRHHLPPQEHPACLPHHLPAGRHADDLYARRNRGLLPPGRTERATPRPEGFEITPQRLSEAAGLFGSTILGPPPLISPPWRRYDRPGAATSSDIR
jgi:hypothetical protein